MSDTGRLAGKVAVITGASSGVGAATARTLARPGMRYSTANPALTTSGSGAMASRPWACGGAADNGRGAAAIAGALRARSSAAMRAGSTSEIRQGSNSGGRASAVGRAVDRVRATSDQSSPVRWVTIASCRRAIRPVPLSSRTS